MSKILITFKGEIRKQRENYFNSLSGYISLFIWPMLVFFTTNFTYDSFDLSYLLKFGINSKRELTIFLITGSMGYYCFWSLVQSALLMQNERENGTLEMVFLTPGNRFSILYGRALGGLVQNIWMFSIFSLLIIIIINGTDLKGLIIILFGFIILLVSATIWGGFINAIFITSRDVNFWFTICDEPMNLLSGTKIPVTAFPHMLQAASTVFPLTYCLIFIRAIFSNNFSELNFGLIASFIISQVVLIVLTYIIIIIAEKHNRKTGNLQLY